MKSVNSTKLNILDKGSGWPTSMLLAYTGIGQTGGSWRKSPATSINLTANGKLEKFQLEGDAFDKRLF